MRRARTRLSRGNLLVGLLIMIAVSSIMLARAVPSWQTVAKRDREEELIFRGEAYGEAIRFFQKKNGRLPVSLEELHKKPANCIRKLYKDPMTKDDEGKWGGAWGIIFAGPNGQPILPGQPPPGQPADPGKPPPPGGTPPGGTPPFGSTPPATPSPTPGSGSFGSAPGGGPIIGVYSKSEEESIKLYDGKDHYNEWYFVMKQEQPRPGQGSSTDPNKPPGGQTPPPAPPK